MKFHVLAIGTLCLCGLVSDLFGQDPAERKRPGQKSNPSLQLKSQDPAGKTAERGPGSGQAKGRQKNPLAEIASQLDLNDDQREEIRTLLQEFQTQLRQQPDGAQAGDRAALQATRQKREEVISRLRSQGLEGKALKQAAMQELGISRPEPGSRPKDNLMQKQAELIRQVREVLSEEQRDQLDELLRARAAERKAAGGNDPAGKRPGKPGSNPSAKQGKNKNFGQGQSPNKGKAKGKGKGSDSNAGG